MDVLVASLPAYGHLYPMMPLVLALDAAGHRVRVATGAPFLDALPVETVRGLPAHVDLAWAERETRERHPEAEEMQAGLAMFGHVVAEVVTEELLRVFEQHRPELVVFEGTDTGAAIAAHLSGIPALGFGVGQWEPFGAMLTPATVKYGEDQWAFRGQEPPADPFDLLAGLLQPLPPTYRIADGPDGRPVLPIRSVAFSQSRDVPTWLFEERSRPVVYVTLGTVAFGAVETLRAAVEDLAALDVDVHVAAGPEGDPEAVGDVPPNVRVERFVAQDRVLGLVDLVVHHGGMGTTLGAFEHGLPQVVLPQGADQFLNAGRLAEVGAGRPIEQDGVVPGAVGAAVEELLVPDAPERAAARALQAEVAAMPAPADVVADLEALVAAGS